MNPLISPNNSLFLPLSQLNPHCTRLLNSLNNGSVSQKDRISYEQTLWNEVKKIRALKDTSIFLYLIGYYHTILFQVASTYSPDDLFQYHVLIRLGDLNRYMERIDVAEYYYCNARNLFPFFGHAYNQLGLLTKPTNCYKCCYYYARAAKSSDRPLTTIADSNLRIAVSKYSCEILNHILNDVSCLDVGDGAVKTKLPETAFDWFCVIVVAIYADNIQPIAKLFLCYLNENFSTQRATTVRDNVKTTIIYCDQDSYMLLACLDILLDWLRLGSQGKMLCPIITPELRRIRTCLQSIIASFNSDRIQSLSASSSNITTNITPQPAMDTSSTRGSANLSNSSMQGSYFTSASDSSFRGALNKLPALPHDYILRGFGPLDGLHSELIFQAGNKAKTRGFDDGKQFKDSSSDHRFIESDQLMQVLQRIRSKMDAFGPLIKKRTRNIALESILSNMSANNG